MKYTIRIYEEDRLISVTWALNYQIGVNKVRELVRSGVKARLYVHHVQDEGLNYISEFAM